jgi:hypothetical protein
LAKGLLVLKGAAGFMKGLLVYTGALDEAAKKGLAAGWFAYGAKLNGLALGC